MKNDQRGVRITVFTQPHQRPGDLAIGYGRAINTAKDTWVSEPAV